MKHLVFGLLISVLAACSSHHPDVYRYNNQAYTTTAVSEFEVDHFKAYGTSNFVMLEDSSLKKTNSQRKKEIESLCLKYRLDCVKIDLSSKKVNLHDEIVKVHESFNNQKYFVFSVDKKSTALFAGTLNILVDKGDESTLKSVFKQIGVNETDELENQLLALKKTN